MTQAINLEMVNHATAKILYFEDDKALANLTIKILEEKHYQVFWYDHFPQDGTLTLNKAMSGSPDLVLIDIGMPDIDGYEICTRLRQDYLSAVTPVLFTSGRDSTNEIMKCYEVGGDDYLQKPLRNKELIVKIDKAIEGAKEAQQKDALLSDARTMVYNVMTSSSELGEILHFFEASLQINNFNDLAKLLLETVSNFSVKSSVMFYSGNKSLPYSSDHKEHPLEEKVFNTVRDKGRIIDVGNKTLFNYPSVSLLIKNMPINDPERYGHLKDQFCLLMNSIDARVKALDTILVNERQSEHIKIVANVIGNMVEDMKVNSLKLSKGFEEVIINLEMNVSSDLLRFNLLQEEEDSLMEHIANTIKNASKLFESSVQFEKQYGDVMQDLLSDLNSNGYK